MATKLALQSVGSVVDEITNVANGSKLLDQNFLPIKNKRVQHLYMQNESIFNAHLLSDVIIYNDSYARRPLEEILFTEKTFQMLKNF